MFVNELCTLPLLYSNQMSIFESDERGRNDWNSREAAPLAAGLNNELTIALE
jgi:hypothetical protein